MAQVQVTDFYLTADGKKTDSVRNLLMLKLRIEYIGSAEGIFAGDSISVEIDNAANGIIAVTGIGNSAVDIRGDGEIGKVGVKTYQNNNGNYAIEVVFDEGYKRYYNGNMPPNITGWLESSAIITYKEWVRERAETTIEATVNGIGVTLGVHVKPGAEPAPERPEASGPVLGINGRYGSHSANYSDSPEVAESDCALSETLRWGLHVGFQNLTWRDLRASNGDAYFTTEAALTYSNTHPDAPRYQSSAEPYFLPYAEERVYPIDDPFLYKNCVLEDYLTAGNVGKDIGSTHEYIQSSLRIVRVLGREANADGRGKNVFKILADKNFLKPAPDEPMDRYLSKLYFHGYRGLTIEEFLTQMRSEGQMTDKTTVADILTFDHVNSGEAPGAADPDSAAQIPHFKLLLGDLHFCEDTGHTVDLVGLNNETVFSGAEAKNLPYAYWIYYDTRAAEALLHRGAFRCFNAAKAAFDGEEHTAYADIWIRPADGSGGSGYIEEISIQKTDAAIVQRPVASPAKSSVKPPAKRPYYPPSYPSPPHCDWCKHFSEMPFPMYLFCPPQKAEFMELKRKAPHLL